VTVRDERAAALKRWHRDMGDNFTAVLPCVLDDLDAIDQAQPGIVLNFSGELTEEETAKLRAQFKEAVNSQPVTVMPPEAPTDDQIAAWIERNPKAFADWTAKQVKVTTTRRRTAR
jgi:hypothetical protein